VKLLAVDTSTEACSAALLIDDEVHARYRLAPRQHAQLILPMVDELMSEAGLRPSDLHALAFGRGPGAFTGLRIAAGVIQGIAFGADLPVVPVSSLAALAQGLCRERGAERILAAIDARMAEVYWGMYRHDERGLVGLIDRERLCAPAAVPHPEGEGWYGAGSGWQRYGMLMAERLGAALLGWDGQRYPAAEDVARLGAAGFIRGEAVAAEAARPVYLRDEVAVKPQ
jgi:tRNA threonylcarbamoyladenosine biosynthesis protein TsaB